MVINYLQSSCILETFDGVGNVYRTKYFWLSHTQQSHNFPFSYLLLLFFLSLLRIHFCKNQYQNFIPPLSFIFPLLSLSSFRNPNKMTDSDPDSGEWPEYTTNKQKYLELTEDLANNNPSVGRGPKADKCAFWRDYLPTLQTQTGEYIFSFQREMIIIVANSIEAIPDRYVVLVKVLSGKNSSPSNFQKTPKPPLHLGKIFSLFHFINLECVLVAAT